MVQWMVGCGWKPVSFRILPFRSEDDGQKQGKLLKDGKIFTFISDLNVLTISWMFSFSLVFENII